MNKRVLKYKQALTRLDKRKSELKAAKDCVVDAMHEIFSEFEKAEGGEIENTTELKTYFEDLQNMFAGRKISRDEQIFILILQIVMSENIDQKIKTRSLYKSREILFDTNCKISKWYVRNELLYVIHNNGKISIDEISRLICVSQSTIKQEIDKINSRFRKI